MELDDLRHLPVVGTDVYSVRKLKPVERAEITAPSWRKEIHSVGKNSKKTIYVIGLSNIDEKEGPPYIWATSELTENGEIFEIDQILVSRIITYKRENYS